MRYGYGFRFILFLGSLAPMSGIAGIVPTASQTATINTVITVHITGIRNTKGQILIQLWNAADGFPMKGEKGFKATNLEASKVNNGVITTTFVVPPGMYAVSTLHDENANGRMDTNLLGIPKEGYGASNNPVSHLHAPSFSEAEFQVPVSGLELSIGMRY